MGITTASFSYSDQGTPAGYCCGNCGAIGVKLWRDYNAFLEFQRLRCGRCASESQDEDYSRVLVESDQIGWMIPAVPTEDGATYWGYGSVPQAGCDWWRRLPVEMSDRPNQGEDDEHAPTV